MEVAGVWLIEMSELLWDVHALDLAFDSLPDDNDRARKNSFDDAWVNGEHS